MKLSPTEQAHVFQSSKCLPGDICQVLPKENYKTKENDIKYGTLEDFGQNQTHSIIPPEQNTSDNRTES